MNITLIGMSGAGKSTVGKLVAEQLSYDFYDVDQVMEAAYQKPLQVILDELGDAEFLLRQEQQILRLGAIDQIVIAPGGSAVYSKDAMEYIKTHSHVVYLEVVEDVLLARITTIGRGIVGLQDKSYSELLQERITLYEQWADSTIQVADQSPEEVALAVLKLVK